MSNVAIRTVFEPLRTLAYGSISGTYTAIGTGFSNPIRVLWIFNTTDIQVTFSVDGVTDNFILPASGHIILDITANMTATGGALMMQVGQKIYAKGTDATLGGVYLSAIGA